MKKKKTASEHADNRKNDPSIKVTFLGKGWGIRCFAPSGKMFDETFVKARTEIGPACRDLLRWWDKMGGISKYAYEARHRVTRKELKREQEKNNE